MRNGGFIGTNYIGLVQNDKTNIIFSNCDYIKDYFPHRHYLFKGKPTDGVFGSGDTGLRFDIEKKVEITEDVINSAGPNKFVDISYKDFYESHVDTLSNDRTPLAAYRDPSYNYRWASPDMTLCYCVDELSGDQLTYTCDTSSRRILYYFSNRSI